MRNTEIKAKIDDLDRFTKLVKDLCRGQDCTVLQQRDTFFESPSGRLKLRIENANNRKEVSELIYYDRPNIEGPKLSNFYKAPIIDHESLRNVLKLSMGIIGEVKKQRILFIYEQTRIHIDDVEGIGTFIELEVVLRHDQTPEQGKAIAESIMEKLEIKPEQLIAESYINYILKSDKKMTKSSDS